MSTAIVRSGGGFIVAPANLAELKDFCIMLANSELVPRDYQNKPANVLVAIQMGAELGVSPLQALQNISVVNGRGSVWGDLMLALCMARPDYVDTIETYDATTKTARCIAKRQGRSDKDWTFSWADAQNVKQQTKNGVQALTDKDTYKNYPRRMLQQRARSFALRDQWTDVLKGVITREEAEDYPAEVRAEVVSSKALEEPKAPEQQQERKSTPPPAAEPPSFAQTFPNKNYAGAPLAACTDLEILSDYKVWLESQLPRTKAKVALEALAAEFARRIEEEAPKPDPIIAGLEKVVHEQRSQPGGEYDTKESWGFEAPQ